MVELKLNFRRGGKIKLFRKARKNRRFNQEAAVFLHLCYKNDIFPKSLQRNDFQKIFDFWAVNGRIPAGAY